MTMQPNFKLTSGFSLVEMAVVLMIVGFVLGALLMPIQVQRQQQAQAITENMLEIAKKSLLGYAQTQGRLPCPAVSNTADDKGVAKPVAGGACAVTAGFLPAVTLGIQPVDANGFALDGWGNPIRYAVTQSKDGGLGTPDFTTTGAMGTVGIAALKPNLRVCASSTSCTEDINLVKDAVAVIYSLGATAADGPGGADENENLNGDAVFVSHEPSRNQVNGEFDHVVVWMSPYILYNAMIEAGQLH